MPALWDQSIKAHRRGVREAILETTAALVREHGLLSVTMSQIAQEAGIGRATLYKHFPDVESVLQAWHDHHVEHHLEQLRALRDGHETTAEALRATMSAYAEIRHHQGRHGTDELAALLHRGEQIASARRRLHDLFRALLADAAADGDIRADVPPDELAAYCLHSLAAAQDLQSGAAVARLVALTFTGLRPPASA